MFRSRRFYLSLLGVVAWSSTAADTVLSILDAALLSLGEVSFVGLSIAASGLDVVSLFCVGLYAFQYAWKRDGFITSARARRIFSICCILFSGIALTVSLASIVLIKTKSKEISSKTSGAAISDWDSLISAQVAIWILTCIGQIALYSSPLWSSRPRLERNSIAESGARTSTMSEVRNSNHTTNLYMMEPTMPSSPLAALPSPTFSARSSQSLRSWRESLQHVVRPSSSRTKLIKQSSFSRDAQSVYSDGQSIDTASHTDAFDTWDTSSVSSQTRDAVMQSVPSRGTALETIPGSRPASPARALDGPFPLESDDGLAPPPKMMPDRSRPPSPAVSEAHIHPLFRTESPTPPPAATPGTSIMASPLANQAIACPPRPYSRMRSNSRAASPSPLVHTQAFQNLAINPQETSRSPTPPSREMTPPIPDFVLNGSPRSSMSGNRSQRRVNLHM